MAATLLLASTAFAQRPGGGGGGGNSVANRVAFLAGLLSLTDAQKTQATTIFTAAETAQATLAGQMTTARTALHTAIQANAADAELDRLSAAVGTITAQQTAVKAKAEARFYALLTTEQKTKYDALGDRSGGPGGGMGGRRFARPE